MAMCSSSRALQLWWDEYPRYVDYETLREMHRCSRIFKILWKKRIEFCVTDRNYERLCTFHVSRVFYPVPLCYQVAQEYTFAQVFRALKMGYAGHLHSWMEAIGRLNEELHDSFMWKIRLLQFVDGIILHVARVHNPTSCIDGQDADQELAGAVCKAQAREVVVAAKEYVVG